MDTDKRFSSSNLALCAAIHSKGCQLIDHFHGEFDGKVIFYFDDYEKCKEYEQKWLANTLEVKAHEYHLSLRILKGVLYADK